MINNGVSMKKYVFLVLLLRSFNAFAGESSGELYSQINGPLREEVLRAVEGSQGPGTARHADLQNAECVGSFQRTTIL
jgi:hypothetical protein